VNANFAALSFSSPASVHSRAARPLSPATSGQGNRFGIAGMVIRRAHHVALIPASGLSWLLVAGFAIGGGFGACATRTGADDAMRNWWRWFHSPLWVWPPSWSPPARSTRRSVRHREGEGNPSRQPDRNVARPRHRPP